MALLTTEQQLFLEHQRIPLSRVFDASGMSKSEYQREMGELEMVVACGVSPCKKAGHTLRTRGGHCAQCNTHALAFVMRWDDRAEIYVAYSSQEQLTKIGVAKDHRERLRTLNDHGYGGVIDWIVHFCCDTDNAGKVEFMVQQTLNQHRVTRSYSRTGKTIDCQELFACDVNLAVEAIKRSLNLIKQ